MLSQIRSRATRVRHLIRSLPAGVVGVGLPILGAVVALVSLFVFSVGPASLASQTSGDSALADKVTDSLGSNTTGFDALSVTVFDSDGAESHAGFGSQADGQPITRDTSFEIGSVAKGLTGMLLASLESRGLVDSSTAFDARVDAPPGPSLAELATHHAGLPRDSPSIWRVAEIAFSGFLDRQPLDDTAADVGRDVGSAWKTGASFSYSNLGFAALGVALGESQGMAFEELLSAEVLGPLEMTDTVLRSPEDPVPRESAVGLGLNYRPTEPWVSVPWQGAGVGVWSTARDLGTLMGAIADGTAPGIEATTGKRTATEGQRVGYGWLVSSVEGESVVWHNGRTAGFRSFVAHSPSTGRAVVVLSNSSRAPIDDLALSLLVGTTIGGSSKLSVVVFHGLAIVMLWIIPARRLRSALRGGSSRLGEIRANAEMVTSVAVAYLLIDWRLVDLTVLHIGVVISGAAIGASAATWSRLPTSIAKRPWLDAVTAVGSAAAGLFALWLTTV